MTLTSPPEATDVSPDTKPPTYPQRSALAAAQASAHLNLSDEKRMLAALSLVALEELQRNMSFATLVYNRYLDLAPKKVAKSSKTAKPPKIVQPKLTPIKELPSLELDATRRLDPWFILEYYGKQQLETALRIQTPGNLREAVAIVEERYPGTAPKGKVGKEGAIRYILNFVHE